MYQWLGFWWLEDDEDEDFIFNFGQSLTEVSSLSACITGQSLTGYGVQPGVQLSG